MLKPVVAGVAEDWSELHPDWEPFGAAYVNDGEWEGSVIWFRKRLVG